MKLFSRHQIFYIALPLLAFFVSGIDAQSPEEIAVSVSYSGPAEISESTVRNKRVNSTTGEIEYTLGNPPTIRFTVSLSRALADGEFVNVPLNINGIDGPLSLDDITMPTMALDATANTGVTLTGTNTLLPTVSFRGAGAQTAGLQITVKNDNELEPNAEEINVVLVEPFSSAAALNAVRGSITTPTVVIKDDDYTICFDSETRSYVFDETNSIGRGPIVVTTANDEGLPRDITVIFEYEDFVAKSNFNPRPRDGAFDYTEVYTIRTNSFLGLPAGTTEYTLEIPIVQDIIFETNELFRINLLAPETAAQQSCFANIIIRDLTVLDMSITANQAQIIEGSTATFTVTPSIMGGPPEIERLLEAYFVISDSEGNSVRTVFDHSFPRFIFPNSISAPPKILSISSVDDELNMSDRFIKVELDPLTTGDSMPVAGMSSATVVILDDDQPVSIVSALRVHKGDDAIFTIKLDAPRRIDITVLIDIAEIERTAGKDFIAASDEGRKRVVVPAGVISIDYRIPTRLLDDGNIATVGRVTVSLVPSPDYAYAIASPASVSIDIIDIVCGYAIDVDTDDDGLIEICDIEDLDAMRQQLDGSGYRASRTAPLLNAGCDEDGDQGGVCRGYELTRNLDFESPDSYLSGSINREWTEGLGWQPIGESLRAFSGHFEANGFAITNLYINRPVDNVGLIRNTAPSALINNLILLQADIRGQSQVGALVAVNEGIVSNINLINSTIVGTGDTIGGLIGRNKGTVIKNNVRDVTLTGGITELRCDSDLTSTNCADAEKSLIVLARGNNVGGLIGNNEGELSNNFASVDQVLGGSRVGGLVGTHSGITFNNNEAGGSVRGSEYAGGLVGYSIGAIADSKSIADVSVRAGGSYAGGLVGYGEGDISDSEADGAEVSGDRYVGGLVGYGEGDISDSEADDTEVSGDRYVGGLVGYSEGDINDSEAGDTEVSGGTHVGGLAGYSEGDISDSEADDTEVSGSTHVGGLAGTIEAGIVIRSNASGAVQGSSEVGGLVGSIEAGEIAESYASGAVTGIAQNIGGLVGSIEAAEIAESYASGAVQGSSEVGGLVGSIEAAEIAESYASGAVTGTAQNIGGLVGTAFSTTITVAYATGVVTGDNSTDPGIENDVDNVGGLVGKAESAVIIKGYALNPSVQGVDKVGGLIGIKSGGHG